MKTIEEYIQEFRKYDGMTDNDDHEIDKLASNIFYYDSYKWDDWIYERWIKSDIQDKVLLLVFLKTYWHKKDNYSSKNKFIINSIKELFYIETPYVSKWQIVNWFLCFKSRMNEMELSYEDFKLAIDLLKKENIYNAWIKTSETKWPEYYSRYLSIKNIIINALINSGSKK